MNVFIDIETIPQQPEEAAKLEIAETIKAPANMKKQETIDAWHAGEGKYEGEKEKLIDEVYRKTSFDAAKGQIASIAWAVEDTIPLGALATEQGEATMIKLFFDQMEVEMQQPNKNYIPPYFIGHYVAGFDLKFIWQRAVILGVKPPFPLKFRGKHYSDYFCTMTEWAGYKDRISQENLCKALGIKGKSDMDGSMVWDEWKAGNHEKVLDYNLDDVRIVREIYKKMTFSI